jgi:hypothetical protein
MFWTSFVKSDTNIVINPPKPRAKATSKQQPNNNGIAKTIIKTIRMIFQVLEWKKSEAA